MISTANNEVFFDDISEFYDSMIDFDTALNRRKEFLKNILKLHYKTAADLGCGTGLDSIALASLGLKVTAFDLSNKMIEYAKKNSIKAGFEINFNKSGIENISRSYHNKFDIAFSLGNTLANLNPLQLQKAIRKIYNLLTDGGNLVVQILNFEKIISTGERIINITNKDKFSYVRFYDFLPTRFNFNILKFETEHPSERKLFTTKLYPHKKSQLLSILKQSGFRKIKFYDSLTLGRYIHSSSKDLVITAEK